MRRTLLLLFLVALAYPSRAANKIQPVTVAQLDQFLTGSKGQSDDKIAKDLQAMTLTERVPQAQFATWLSDLPGRHSRDALTAMADLAMLSPVPQASVLSDPPPDIHAQGAIFSHAINYVAGTLVKLPDFYATRTTQHFEDEPAQEGAVQVFGSTGARGNSDLGSNPMLGIGSNGGGVPRFSQQVISAQPLHLTGQSSAQVTYSNGVEMRGAEKMDIAAINQPAPGLQTAGEFGPILSVVLSDATHGSIDWAYWQQSPGGKLAVFRYSVPEDASSYALALKHGNRDEKLFPAYHGEIAIDPNTGAVLRITLVANSLRSQYVIQSAMTVEYAPVTLGGKDYICPVKGTALLKTELNSGLQTQVNDSAFTDYHLARGDVTILPAHP